MERLKPKVNQLVIEAEIVPGQKNQNVPRTHVRTFATKPIGGLPYEKGKIFGLIEVASTHPDIPRLIDFIIEEIKNNYYYNDEIDELSISDQFEATLKKTNLSIASFLESEYIQLDFDNVNIIVALTRNQDLYFSTVGNAGAFLFYNISQLNYQIINILETSKTPSAGVDPLKIFSQVVSGKMRSKDSLFLTTSNLLDYFSLDSIKNIITEPDGILHLRELIEKTKSKENFAIISLELNKMAQVAKKPISTIENFDYAQAALKDSINELIRTEKETEKLLTPSLMPEFKKYASSLTIAFKNYVTKAKSSPSALYNKQKTLIKPIQGNIKSSAKGRPASRGRLITNIQNKNIKKIGRGINLSKNITGYQVKKVIQKISNNGLSKKIILVLESIFGSLKTKFSRLPNSSKIFLTISIFLAVTFSASLFLINTKNSRADKIESFNQIIVEVTNKKNEAESSLIYRDENQARQLLIDSKNLLKSLEPSSQSQEEQKKLLRIAIEEQLQALQHIIEITDPVQIVNFQNIDEQANMASIALASGDNFYSQNLNDKAVYKANLDTRVMSAIISPETNTGDFKFGTPASGNEFVLFNTDKQAFSLNPNNDLLQRLNISIAKDANIVDGDIYNNRLYLLDQAGEQIYRYSRVTGGYGSVRNWITDDRVDLSNATSLSVDGSIYVLNSDGTIILLQNGVKVDFKNHLIDPPLQSSSKLKTLDGSNYLYFLDVPTNRLIVLDKEGNLVIQYTSDAFTDLKDFIISEATKEIYVLSGSTVYGISAEHLN